MSEIQQISGLAMLVLAEPIQTKFGSYEAFKTAFSEAALAQFGSGWVWLVQEGDLLKIGH